MSSTFTVSFASAVPREQHSAPSERALPAEPMNPTSAAEVIQGQLKRRLSNLRQDHISSRLLDEIPRRDQHVAASMLVAEAYRFQRQMKRRFTEKQRLIQKEEELLSSMEIEGFHSLNDPLNKPGPANRQTKWQVTPNDPFEFHDGQILSKLVALNCLKDVEALMTSPLWDDPVQNPAKDLPPSSKNHPYLFTIGEVAKLKLFPSCPL